MGAWGHQRTIVGQKEKIWTPERQWACQPIPGCESKLLERNKCVPIANCPDTGVFFHAISSCPRQFFVGSVHASLDAGQVYANLSSGC